MTDRCNGDRVVCFIDAVEDEVGQARDREAPQTAARRSSGLRMQDESAQGSGELLLDVSGGSRIACFEIGGDAFEIVPRSQ